MKLYQMKCIKDPERMDECFEPDNQEEHWFVKLETKAEWRILENVQSYGADLSALNSMIRTTGDDVMGDDDIYYYLGVDEPEPAIGEEYKDADGLVWERVE